MAYEDWSIEGYPGQPEIVDTSRPVGTWGRTVAVINQQSGHPLESHPETDALAALFMAAPKLLEACKLALPYVQHELDCGEFGTENEARGEELLPVLKEAIAEAEHRQQG